MVKIGFIVEGDTEKILLESNEFRNLLNELRLEYVSDVINASGNGNLLPHNISKHSQILRDKGATHIFILTDLDKDKCVTETKNRINPETGHFCIVSKKQIEAWFLADTVALRNFIAFNLEEFERPEDVENPFEEIKRLRMNMQNRGFSNKRYLANSIISSSFSIKRAANHPNCSSARYFIEKLTQLSRQN